MTIYSELREGIAASDWSEQSTQPVSGYRGFDAYPAAYQATEFPKLGNKVRITGNNQAFFFVRPIKDANGNVIDVEENTTALKALIKNIIDQGKTSEDRPEVTLQIDADVFVDPQKFVDKYQALRSEVNEATRRELLGKEVNIIRRFIETGGIQKLVEEVLRENSASPAGENSLINVGAVVNPILANGFLQRNFKVQGVRTDVPLSFATWDIQNGNDSFVARQEYKTSTFMTNRPWQLGTEAELSILAQKGHTGAQQVLEAVNHTRELPAIDLTRGFYRSNRQVIQNGRGDRSGGAGRG